ncbi:hypothetical protein KRR39_23795 [Nocardioides panacis]|uniref:Aminopeptidase N-like N-terminal domain-containing protein n=1 Tax=Nocardioides panacis TaxID=2849501 RepID=A0A975SYH9_9ACTN|nr:hypothetical protein [Nocardioides panacis]QWZ08294.1 hypothetical protein KRR39_23795 [Nocardioides panacis]
MAQLSRRTGVVVLVALALAVPATAAPSQAVPAGTQGAPEGRFRPGAPGTGDPYFPRDGNRGYDVKRYVLDLRYRPSTGRLAGVATIRARSTQDLSRFNLDLDGLRVRSVRVDGRRATWRRHAGELTIDPQGPGLRRGHRFRTVIRYGGRPRLLPSQSLGAGGFFHTDDGAVVAGQPHAASAWFPVNDHPTDKAGYTFRISAPRALQVVANGTLERRRRHGAFTTWTWSAGKPMASYLATMAIGHFALSHHRRRGISYWDAIDSRLFQPVAAPRTGRQLAIGQQADSSYKRLTRSIDVPAGGAQLSFWVTRNTEPDWDFFFVEAHTAGLDDWTTLADTQGHTSTGTGASCPSWLGLHPFLAHYQTPPGGRVLRRLGEHRVVARGVRRQRRLRELGGRPQRLRRTHGRGVAQPGQRRDLPDVRRLRRRRHRLHRPGQHLVRGGRRHPGRVDDPWTAAREPGEHQ